MGLGLVRTDNYRSTMATIVCLHFMCVHVQDNALRHNLYYRCKKVVAGTVETIDIRDKLSSMRRRLCAAYHIERSLAQRLALPEYPCACNRCRGARIKKVNIVARHHISYGRDPYLVYPVMVSVGALNQFYFLSVFGFDGNRNCWIGAACVTEVDSRYN